MNSAVKKINNEIIKEIQEVDRNILTNSLVTSVEDIKNGFDLISQLKASPTASKTRLAELEMDLFNIFEKKVKLTKEILQTDNMFVNSNEDITNPQQKLIFPNEGNKVIQMNPKIPAEKEKVIEENKIKYFEGYTRKVIFGTPTKISKKLQILIPLADTETKIDEIAKLLVDENRHEDALNLSIDLFEKFNLMSREKVEERFIFEVLPLYYGVKLSENKGLEKLTLVKWIEFLKDAKELIKSKSSIVNMAITDIKKNKFISFKTQIELNKFNSIDTSVEDDVILTIAKEVKSKPEDLVYEAVNNTDAKLLTEINRKFIITGKIEDAVIIEESKTCNLAELRKKCLEILKDKNFKGDRFLTAHKCFEDGIKLVTDYPSKDDKEKTSVIWNLIKEEYKNTLGGSKPELTETASSTDKEKIVEEAENKAIELQQKEESKTKEDKSNNTSSIPPLNESVDIQKEYPEIWETACICTTLKDFKDVIIMILSNKEKDIKSTSGKFRTKYMIASFLATQFVNKITESKDWNREKVVNWFIEVRDNYKKEFEKEDKVVKSPNVKESSGTPKAEDSSEKKGGKLGEEKNGKQSTKQTQNTNSSAVVSSNVQNVKTSSFSKKNANTDKPGEDKGPASQTATQQTATGKNAGQNNVQNKPAGDTISTVTPTVPSANTKIDTKDGKSGESKVTSVEKTGQNIVLTTENKTAEVVKDVKIVDNGKATGVTGEDSVPTTSSIKKEDVKDVVTEDVVKTIENKEGDSKLGEEKSVITNQPISVTKETQNGQHTITPSETVTTVTSQENGTKEKEELTDIQKKYNIVAKEKDTNRIKAIIEDFLLEKDYKTFPERVNEFASHYLPLNKKWHKCPNSAGGRAEMLNFVISTIKKSDKLKELEETKAYLADIKAKADAKFEAKKLADAKAKEKNKK
jgi:hypothetical protein